MIYLGSDHAGYELKGKLAEALNGLRQDVHDLGANALDPADDYPDYAFAVGEAVVAHPGSFGILVCGSAQGVCIAANKVEGVRAVAVQTEEEAARAREHNDANVLCLSGWNMDLEDAKPVIAAFLGTRFQGEERHARRIGKISAYESR
jgi:ribose 5-phosphate isomerase B